MSELNILLLSFSKQFVLSIAEKAVDVNSVPWPSVEPTVVRLWLCPLWPFLAFLPAVISVWHPWVDDIVSPDLHLTGLIVQSAVWAASP